MTAGPLADTRVVVTRAAHQARGLTELFQAEGAQVEPLPLLEILEPQDGRPLERAGTELALFEWIVFTSANSVEALMEVAGGSLPQRLQIAAIGAATARALARYDIEPDLMPESRRAEGLVAALAPRVRRRERVLLPQAADARSVLEKGLRAAGGDVVRVDAYRKQVPADSHRRAELLFPSGECWGWVSFTSPSTVRNLAQLLGERWAQASQSLRAASIGPVTSDELRSRGVEPTAKAASPTDRSLVEAVVAANKGL